MAKKLYILISNGGDGSYSTQFTLDKAVIDKLQDLYDRDLLDYETGPGIDGDGFHYNTLEVPDECTYESLGISWPLTIEDELFENTDD